MKMMKPKALRRGDKVMVVSLSKGILGEEFVKHEIPLFERRLKEIFGLEVSYADNARRGMEYLSAHPEARVADLKQAFLDSSVKIIWTAIGGDDTFRTLPFIMNDEFSEIVRNNPKIFMGFSDTTNNHLALYKMGLMTYYGPALLADVAELGPKLFDYTEEWIKRLFESKGEIEIKSSPIWYGERKSFGVDQLGVERNRFDEKHGFEFLNGSGVISGKLLGGCLDSLYEMLMFGRYDDQKEIFSKFPIFPSPDEWRDKILFIETSEERPTPEKYREMLKSLEKAKVFENIRGIMSGKPQNEVYYEEYKEILSEFLKKYGLPAVWNMNFGHSTPRLILPYGQEIQIDFDSKKVKLSDSLVGER